MNPYESEEFKKAQRVAFESAPTTLPEAFERAKIKTKTIEIKNGGEFSKAIILERKEVPQEKMVRLYRGINHLDASLLSQAPYAMRKERDSGKPEIVEDVREAVDTLAKNPTYENLLAYLEKMRPHMNKKEAHRAETELLEIEDAVLNGSTARKELAFNQIKHGGGWGDSGITPYISASYDPYFAAGYGDKGVLVIDVPLSEIEDIGVDTSEANLKGALDPKYITAILPREMSAKSVEERNADLHRALETVYSSSIDVPVYSDEELQTQRQEKQKEMVEQDSQQWPKDVELVRQRRTEKLLKEFPGVEIAQEEGVDTYTQAKRSIFDYYKTRLERIGKNPRDIKDYGYWENTYSAKKDFDREHINDAMLKGLRALVRALEAREEERRM